MIFQILILSLLAACAKDDAEDPCFICPIDFNVTDSEPAWSPNGDWIAFGHGDLPGKVGIYLISPDGQKIEQWHQGPANAPAWSPDGQWIAFSENAQIWKKKINGDSLTQLTFEGRNFFSAWGPDGDLIAFDNTTCGSAVSPAPPNSCGILGLDINTFKIQYLVSGRFPDWAGSKNKMIYVGLHSELYEFDFTDSSANRLTFLNQYDIYGTDNSYPKFSSHNGRIVFSSQSLNGNGLPQIWTMNADGSDLEQLTNTQGYSCDWSPDGTKIVYTDSRRENGRLWTMDEDGGNKRQLTFEYHF